MDLGLSDRTLVVTGGSAGIGFATAALLLGEGANVAICGRNAARLEAAAEQLRGLAPSKDRVLAEVCDVLDDGQVGTFKERTVDAFGKVDGLINNAGGGRVSTFETTDDAAWMAELELKIFSVVRPTRAFLPLLKQSDVGAVVNVNSMLALQPEPHMVATSAARASLLNLTRSMAAEFAPSGVRVNSILLGIVSSEQWRKRHASQGREGETYEAYLRRLANEKGIPLGRFGEPEEPARALAFLVSPASSFTTGASIDVSGGVARHI